MRHLGCATFHVLLSLALACGGDSDATGATDTAGPDTREPPTDAPVATDTGTDAGADDVAADVATDDAGPDVTDNGPIVPAPITEGWPGPPIPDTVWGDLESWQTDCEVAGHAIPQTGADVVDACVICQCTTFGGRCARRPTCPRDVCVFVDGTTAAPGETVRLDHCFVCTCDEGGGSCVRDVEAPCPAEGCLLPTGDTIAPGTERFVSECHVCTCDPTLGVRCTNLCHPSCELRVGGDEWIPDQARAPADDGCGSCVCDYGSVSCDPRGCDPDCVGVQGCAD